MKWANSSYIRVTSQNGYSFVHLVTEQCFRRKDSFLLKQTEDRTEARFFAVQQAAERNLTCRFEDEESSQR